MYKLNEVKPELALSQVDVASFEDISEIRGETYIACRDVTPLDQAKVAALTSRQFDILSMRAMGLTNITIGSILLLKPSTVYRQSARVHTVLSESSSAITSTYIPIPKDVIERRNIGEDPYSGELIPLDLKEHELRTFKAIQEHKDAQEIAEESGLSQWTIRGHVFDIAEKLELDDTDSRLIPVTRFAGALAVLSQAER